MISVQEAIIRYRRDATLGMMLKSAFVAGLLLIVALHFFPGRVVDPSLLMFGLAIAWGVLWARTIKGERQAAVSSTLIAAGELKEAEAQLAQIIRSFSLSRVVKSMSLLTLAQLRLNQKRWPDSALLCREVLTSLTSAPEAVSKSSRLILADSLLELGDLIGAHEALAGLYRHRLTLGEALRLLRVQCDYLARIGAWTHLMDGMQTKVELAELMPTRESVRVQALLALAAKKSGQSDWSNWLRRRVELLVDARELAGECPVLWELWQA